MGEQNNGDTQKDTAANNAEEKKPIESNIELELKKTQDELKKINDRLAEKEQQASQLTEEIQKLRQSKKDPLIQGQTEKKPETIETPNEQFNDDDFDIKYQKKREEERKGEYISRVNRCFDRFVGEAKDWDSKIELKFREKANRMHLGDSEDEVFENFKLIYQGILSLNESQSKNKDNDKFVDIGDGGNDGTIKTKPDGDNWLTKKLNRYETEAANHFPGGETAYRKKMLELNNNRQ